MRSADGHPHRATPVQIGMARLALLAKLRQKENLFGAVRHRAAATRRQPSQIMEAGDVRGASADAVGPLPSRRPPGGLEAAQRLAGAKAGTTVGSEQTVPGLSPILSRLPWGPPGTIVRNSEREEGFDQVTRDARGVVSLGP